MKKTLTQWMFAALLAMALGDIPAGAGEIHDAIKAGDTDSAILLLVRDPLLHTNSRGKGDSTPLHWAALYGQPDVVSALLKNEAKVDSRSVNGSTPLHWAARRNMAKIAGMLIEYGADVNAKTGKGYTPLHWAAIGNGSKVAEVLLEAGADIDARARRRSIGFKAKRGARNSSR
jgi:ankyrin repeat protein